MMPRSHSSCGTASGRVDSTPRACVFQGTSGSLPPKIAVEVEVGGRPSLHLLHALPRFLHCTEPTHTLTESPASVSWMCLANVRYETSKNAQPRTPFPQKTPRAESTQRHLQKWGAEQPGARLFPRRPPINIYLRTCSSEGLMRRERARQVSASIAILLPRPTVRHGWSWA